MEIDITYGDLDLNKLNVDFAHYTLRRGRAKKIHKPSTMPKRLWKTEPADEGFTHFIIVDNNGLERAPTRADKIELPITAEMVFPSQDAMDDALLELNNQGLMFDKLTMDGAVELSKDEEGNFITTIIELVDEPTPEPAPKPVDKPVKALSKKNKKSGRTVISSEKFWQMMGLETGDRIQVYDSRGYVCDQYVLIMSFDAIPKLRNARTKRELDILYLLDLEFEIVKRAADFK